jgi:hypothetical protein
MFCSCPTAPAAGRHRRAEHARLPGLPRHARHAAGHQPPRRRAGDAHRPGARLPRRDRGGPLRAQELLLPRPAEGLPDQPVRPAADEQRPPRRAGAERGQRGHHRHHPRPPRGGHGADAARRPRLQRRRLQPRGRAAHGDRHRAGPALPAQARAYGETLRELLRAIGASQRRHGGGQHADRGQRQPPSAGRHRVRHEGRGQEPQQLPLPRARARVRGRPPRRGARARRDARPGDARLGRGGGPHHRPALARRRRTTTATSPSPICRRCARPTTGSPSSAPSSPSCPRSAAPATPMRSACPPTTPAS